MIDSLAAVSAYFGLDGAGNLGWLFLGSILAGLVRGFSGFGTAMVFLPFAASVMSPIWAITVMIVMDFIAPLIMAPRTIKDCQVRDVLRLGIGCLIGLPIGVQLLLLFAPETFRYFVSTSTFILLILLVTGIRFRGKLTQPMVYGAGGLGGVLGGAVGLAGPPVIMLYLASPLPPKIVRANNFLFLLIADILLLGVYVFQDILYKTPLILGVFVTFTYFAGIVVGTWAFNPEKERIYRIVAYIIIAMSAFLGLPFLG